MNTISLLQETFPDYEWSENETGGYFGSITVQSTFKRVNGDRMTFRHIYIFISGVFDNGGFRYAISWQNTNVIPKGRRNSREVEWNKVFVSDTDKDIRKLIKKLYNSIDTDKFVSYPK